MKQSVTRKKVEKRSSLDEIDPLDDLDIKQLKLVARGRGWGTNSTPGKARARALAIPNKPARPQARKKRSA